MAKLALPGHFTRVSLSRIAQKDCQKRKREIEYMPLKNCPFLTTAYFESLFSMWPWFLPNKEWRQGGERELIYCPPCLRHARNLNSAMRNSQSYKYSLVGAFLFLFVENNSTFTIIISSFNIQMLNRMSKNPWLIKALRNP